MNTILTSPMALAALLPPPPIPGGDVANDVWWRLLGILLVSLVTVAIFLFLFRPPPAVPADGIDERQREEEELMQLAAQLAARGDGDLASVIPLRPRIEAAGGEGSEVSNAAARLRRILGQSTRSEPHDRAEVASRPGEDEPQQTAGAAAVDTERLGQSHAWEINNRVEIPPPVDIWGDLGEVAHPVTLDDEQWPSQSAEAGTDSGDLLGDLVNRRPSEAAGSDTEPVEAEGPTQPPSIAGKIPAEHDLDRLASASQGPGKIVPFVPRTGKKRGKVPPVANPELDEGAATRGRTGAGGRSARVSPITVDAQTRDEIEAAVRQLLFYANTGEVLQGFGLYTDEHLRRFMAESGMPEREFQALFAAVPPKNTEDWTRIEFISRIVRLDGGQISVDVRYVDGHQPNGAERLTFVQDPSTRRWLIDDIRAI